jgi:hypothetical protein
MVLRNAVVDVINMAATRNSGSGPNSVLVIPESCMFVALVWRGN